MADYTTKYVNEEDVRGFFTPPLDYDDITTNEILRKIEAVEDYVEAVYFNDGSTTSGKARIPCLLLIASKIILAPELAKKYYTLSREALGDYEYELAQPISRGTDIQSSPHVISVTWEKMALQMLNKRSTNNRWKVYRSND